jgi:hypothetical protein
MAVLNFGRTFHIRCLEDSIALILKNEELSSPLKVIESENIEKAIEHARAVIDQPNLLDSSEKSILKDFLSELQFARSGCLKKDGNGKYLGATINSSHWKDELTVLEARIKGTFFPVIQRISLEKKLGGSKADLRNEKPAETKPNATLSKFAKTITCFKHVAEKALQIFAKSFWDSLFDRVWPK